MGQHWLKPNWEPGLTVPDLPIRHFLDIGIKAVLLDVDQTLVPTRETLLPKGVKEWVSEARDNLIIHLLSNNPSQKRIGTIADQLGLTYTCGAAKPRRASLRRVREQLQIPTNHIAMVGDRIFTDVLAGNRLGLYTVLVKPLTSDGKASNQCLIQRFERKIALWLGAN